MSLSCKKCGSKDYVRNGYIKGEQRYRCKDCRMNYQKGDKRIKYSKEKKMKVMKCYLEGMGIRSIERLEGVPNPLIIRWIRRFGKEVKEEVERFPVPEEAKDIQILEIDELFSYCKKKERKCTYGYVLIGSEIRLLNLR